MTVTEKVAYLKGLIEGMEIDETSKEGKLLKALMDVLAELAVSVEDLENFTDEMSEQVDAIDEDLDALECDFYDDDECECGCDECGDCDCGDEFYDVTCPNCNEEFCVDEDTLLEGGIDCPNCGEKLEFDLGDDDKDEDKE